MSFRNEVTVHALLLSCTAWSASFPSRVGRGQTSQLFWHVHCCLVPKKEAAEASCLPEDTLFASLRFARRWGSSPGSPQLVDLVPAENFLKCDANTSLIASDARDFLTDVLGGC